MTKAHAPSTQGVRSKWPLLVVGLILMNMAIVAVTVIKATNDPSAATEPDYYNKAMHHDALKAEQNASHALGWHAELALVRPSTTACRVQLHLVDTEGKPITHCTIEVTAFAHVRASQRHAIQLSPAEDAHGSSAYVADISIEHEGLWTFLIRATAQSTVPSDGSLAIDELTPPVYMSEIVVMMPHFAQEGGPADDC